MACIRSHQRSTSTMWRTSPSSDRRDGGTARRLSCSAVSPAHLVRRVERWKSSHCSRLVRSSATRPGCLRWTVGAVHVSFMVLIQPWTGRRHQGFGVPDRPGLEPGAALSGHSLRDRVSAVLHPVGRRESRHYVAVFVMPILCSSPPEAIAVRCRGNRRSERPAASLIAFLGGRRDCDRELGFRASYHDYGAPDRCGYELPRGSQALATCANSAFLGLVPNMSNNIGPSRDVR